MLACIINDRYSPSTMAGYAVCNPHTHVPCMQTLQLALFLWSFKLLCDILSTYLYLHTALRCYVDNKNIITTSSSGNVVTYNYTSSDGITAKYPSGFASCLNLPLSGNLNNDSLTVFLYGRTSSISGMCLTARGNGYWHTLWLQVLNEIIKMLLLFEIGVCHFSSFSSRERSLWGLCELQFNQCGDVRQHDISILARGQDWQPYLLHNRSL